MQGSRSRLTSLVLAALVFGSAATLLSTTTGCKKKTPAEKFGDGVEDAVDDVGDGVEEAVE